MFTIRHASLIKDAHAICEMMRMLAHEEGRLSQLTPQALREQTARNVPPLIIVIAEQPTGDVIGAAIAYQGYDVLTASIGLHLSDIYVMSDYRGKGVGKALFAELASHILSKNGEWISWTMLSENHNARSFYQKIGATTVDVDFMACGVTVLKQLAQKKPV